MRIVDVAEFYSPKGGGVKTYLDQKLAAAARQGHDVTIIAPGPDDRVEERDGGRIVFIEAPALPMDRRYHLFLRGEKVHAWLDRLAPDVVEASSPWRGALIVGHWTGAAASRARKSLVVHSDQVAAHPQVWLQRVFSPHFVDCLFGWYWRYLHRAADLFDTVVVGSDWLRHRLHTYGHIDSRVIPFGVDTALFHPGCRDEALRADLLGRLGLPPTGKLLVGIGRHSHEKQWPAVFRAVAPLIDQGIGMVQIGSGIRRPQVERAAAAAGNVLLLGQIDDRQQLARTLASCDALIHGCRAETFGLVASEALAAGVPLVVPSEGGCRDAAGPGWSALYQYGNPGSAREAVQSLFAQDAQVLRHAAIAAGRTRVAPPDRHFGRLFELYAELIGGMDRTVVPLPLAA